MLHTSSSVSPVTDLVADARGVGCYARNLVTCGYPFSGGCLDGCSSGLTDAITAHCGECVGHLFPSQLQRTAENGYPRVSASSTSEVEQVRRATSRRAVRCASVAFWNASKIFFSATCSLVRLSVARQTIPSACTRTERGAHQPRATFAAGARGPPDGDGRDVSRTCSLAQSRLDLVFFEDVLVDLIVRVVGHAQGRPERAR